MSYISMKYKKLVNTLYLAEGKVNLPENKGNRMAFHSREPGTVELYV